MSASADYVNIVAGSRQTSPAPPTRPRRPPEEQTRSPAASTPTTPQSAVERVGGRQSSVRRRPPRSRQQPQQPQHRRPRSVLSQRISQVYEMAVDGRPACIHKAAVTPVLWLLCQVILVALFALCCIFLSAGHPSQAVEAKGRKPWIRMQFNESAIKQASQSRRNDSSESYNTTGTAYKTLVCTADGSNSLRHCDDMRKFFLPVLTNDNGSGIRIMQEATYRINAAVTFQRTSGVKLPVDASVLIDNVEWITCQEGYSGTYTHCTLFGIRHLSSGTVVSFKTTRESRTIAAHKSTTFFEIEMR